ncbi:hypothetical protein GGQ74_001674 [Desulfobaculum xiamenense]|uniref:Peptidase S8/S53 domain-containing protein n=1 Tax=Desulfobaculum xiamenense TaxID=995050 RepID=A0A846QIK3_9BACT|nr:S8 family serine peptidase [Desulfobaculum xiamenense]NJB68001.1 hypothetical protein [Desulfobaculum xiamenense]
MHNMQFDPLVSPPMEDDADMAEQPATRRALRAMAQDDTYHIIQFDGPVRQQWKDTLTAMGVLFFDYVPEYGFIIKAHSDTLQAIRDTPHVRWVGPYSASFRLSGRIFSISSEQLEMQGGSVRLRVVAFPGEDVSRLRDAIEAQGGVVGSDSTTRRGVILNVDFPFAKLDGLKSVPGIKWIEPAPEPKTNNNVGSDIIGVRGVRMAKHESLGIDLYGESQIVGICDSGLDTGGIAPDHPDFSDGSGGSRVLANVVLGTGDADKSGHGTHVAGIVLGNGMASGSDPQHNSFPKTCFAGMAPKAKLYFQTVGPESGDSSLPGIPVDLYDLFLPAYAAGARIHSNSWGSAGVGEYTSECVAVDDFLWDHKDFLVLYAAGNAGDDFDGDGRIDSFVLDTPGSAKNCLTVGASESVRLDGETATTMWSDYGFRTAPFAEDGIADKPYGMAAFSSRGPTLDGRYKPEIVAPGTRIISTRSSVGVRDGVLPEEYVPAGGLAASYFFMDGTSMATPMTAGAAILMREYLMTVEHMPAPSAALVKTALIHGATDMAPGQYGDGAMREMTSSPSPVQGWGRLHLSRAMNLDDASRVEFHDVSDADAPRDSAYVRTFPFNVCTPGGPFRATLGWTDYPGSEIAAGGLVNDLDLRVRRPDGTWIYPDNARNLSSLEDVRYLDLARGLTTLDGYRVGLRFTPTLYPSQLESVGFVLKNGDDPYVSDVSLVVYAWTESGVGRELYRKHYDFLRAGDTALPIGLSVEAGSVFVVLEKESELLSILATNGNPTGRGMINDGTGWAVAPDTPCIVGFFRAPVPPTSFDRVNNTVSVTLNAAAAGEYVVEVSAHNIPVGPQPYALVMSGLHGDVPTTGENPVSANPVQPAAPALTSLSSTRTSVSAAQVNEENGTSLERLYGDMVEFTATTRDADQLVSMRYAVSNLDAQTAETFRLTKLLGGGHSRAFTYPSYETYEDGNWWLTDAHGGFIDPVRVLDPEATYYVVSVVRDNGPFDMDPAARSVKDPQVLSGVVSSGSAGGSGGGGGGCTVGGGSDVGTALLLLAALVIVIRRTRALRQ